MAFTKEMLNVMEKLAMQCNATQMQASLNLYEELLLKMMNTVQSSVVRIPTNFQQNFYFQQNYKQNSLEFA